MYFRYTLFYDFVYPKYTKCAWGNSKAATDALSAAAFYTGFYRYMGRLLHAQQLAHLGCVVRSHVAVDNLHAAVNMHDTTRFELFGKLGVINHLVTVIP